MARTITSKIAGRSGQLPWATLFLLGAFAYLLHQQPRTSLWYDETVSAYLAQHSWSTLWEWTTQLDIHPPLYFALLKIWVSFTGNSEFALRFFSLLWGWLALAGLLHLGNLWGRHGGWRAATLLLFSGGLLYATGEVRAYSMVLAFSVFSCILLQHKRIYASASLVLIASLTHYVAILLLLAQVIYWLPSPRKLLKFSAIPLIGLVAWGWIGLHTTLPSGLAYPGLISLDDVLNTYWHFFLYGHAQPDTQAVQAAVIIAFISLLCGAKAAEKAALPFWLIVLSISGLLLGTRLFEAKLAGWHGWLIWLGVSLLVAAAGRLGWLGVIGMLYLHVVITPALSLPVRSDWRGVFAYLDQHAAPQDLLFLRSGMLLTAADYYGTDLPIIPLPDVRITDVNHQLTFHEATRLVEQADLTQAQNIWVLVWQGDIMDGQGLAYGLAEYMGGTPLATQQFGDVSLVRYALKRPVNTLFSHILTMPGLGKIHPDGPVLFGVDVYADRRGAGCPVIFHSWWWRGDTDYETIKISYRLIGAQEEIYAQRDHFLGGDTYPQTQWLPYTPTLGRGVLTIPPDVETVTPYLLIYDLAGIHPPQGFSVDPLEVNAAPCEPLLLPQ